MYKKNYDCDVVNCDEKYMKYVGWPITQQICDCKCDCLHKPGNFLFQPETIKAIQTKLTELLQGVHPEGKDILVTEEVICHTLSGIWDNSPRTRELGDIYTRYIIPVPCPSDGYQLIIDRAINIMVTYIRDQFEMIENNKKLTIWTTVRGDFNEHGLRSHSQIKTRERHPQYMMFNMNY